MYKFSKKEIKEMRFKSSFIDAVLRTDANIEGMTDDEILVFYHKNIAKMPNSDAGQDAKTVLDALLERNIRVANESDIIHVSLPMHQKDDSNWVMNHDFLKMVKNSLGDNEHISLEDIDNIIEHTLVMAERILFAKSIGESSDE